MKLANIETIVRIYYSSPEIGNKEVGELFMTKASNTISAKKKPVKLEMKKRNIHSCVPYHISTEIAYEVWGIDIDKCVRDLKRMKTLGL